MVLPMFRTFGPRIDLSPFAAESIRHLASEPAGIAQKRSWVGAGYSHSLNAIASDCS